MLQDEDNIIKLQPEAIVNVYQFTCMMQVIVEGPQMHTEQQKIQLLGRGTSAQDAMENFVENIVNKPDGTGKKIQCVSMALAGKLEF